MTPPVQSQALAGSSVPGDNASAESSRGSGQSIDTPSLAGGNQAESPLPPVVTTRALRGLARLSPEERRRIASKGGKAAQQGGKAHRYDVEQARAAGKKGGLSISKNREHMSKIGRLGGEARALHHADLGSTPKV